MNIKIDEINWIFENDFKVHPKFSFEEQVEQLMEYLGSVDSKLREGSLEVLYSWIEKNLYSDEQLLQLADKMKDNLLVGLGEQNTDSVFL